LVIIVTTSIAWPLYHLDVKSRFLNSTLEETIYFTQSPGFTIKWKEYRVFRLKKALYGLKQVPRAWSKRIDKFFMEQGFKKCIVEHGVYVKGSKETGWKQHTRY